MKVLIPIAEASVEFADVLRWLQTGLEMGATLPEPERARIHALTRKVTMSDEKLNSIVDGCCYPDVRSPDLTARELLELIQDLRDRYEERGKYAPAALEVVKQ